jgi:hypothetical protein
VRRDLKINWRQVHLPYTSLSSLVSQVCDAATFTGNKYLNINVINVLLCSAKISRVRDTGILRTVNVSNNCFFFIICAFGKRSS